MAKFSSTRCFSEQCADRLRPAGHSHVYAPADHGGKVAKTLPQGREARREQFRRTEKIFREDSKALCGIGGGIGVNTGGAFADQIYLILNVVHRGVEIVLPAGNFTQRDKRHAAGPVAVPRIAYAPLHAPQG